MNFGREGFTKDFRRLLFRRLFLRRMSIKLESTILKSTRWKVLDCVGLLSADTGLLIEAANFVVALVLLQCFKRTSWLRSGVLDSNSLTRLHLSHKITDYCRGLHPLLNCRPFIKFADAVVSWLSPQGWAGEVSLLQILLDTSLRIIWPLTPYGLRVRSSLSRRPPGWFFVARSHRAIYSTGCLRFFGFSENTIFLYHISLVFSASLAKVENCFAANNCSTSLRSRACLCFVDDNIPVFAKCLRWES